VRGPDPAGPTGGVAGFLLSALHSLSGPGPLIGALFLAASLTPSLAVPIGYGHSYAPAHYIDAWVAVTVPEGWTPERLERLKARFAG